MGNMNWFRNTYSYLRRVVACITCWCCGIMMPWWCLFIIVTVFLDMVCTQKINNDQQEGLSSWTGFWNTVPRTSPSWSLQKRIPMTTEFDNYGRGGKGKFKVKKKLKQFIMPLLLAYKLKFFTLIPVLVGGLLLLTASTGLAGFFFALFAASMGLKSGGGWGH